MQGQDQRTAAKGERLASVWSPTWTVVLRAGRRDLGISRDFNWDKRRVRCKSNSLESMSLSYVKLGSSSITNMNPTRMGHPVCLPISPSHSELWFNET